MCSLDLEDVDVSLMVCVSCEMVSFAVLDPLTLAQQSRFSEDLLWRLKVS